MNVFFLSNRRKVFSIIVLGVIALASFAYTQYVLENILEQERAGVELWAKAIEYTNQDLHTDTRQQLLQILEDIQSLENIGPAQKRRWVRAIELAESDLANAGLDFIASELIINNRFTVPAIATDEHGQILIFKDISEEKATARTIEEFRQINPPIVITIPTADGGVMTNYVYYGQSVIAQSLRFFPYVQFGLLALFLGLIYMSIRNLRRTEQSNLWVGMAKEAAHQLGTPLSSMMGWIELLKSPQNATQQDAIVHELQEDVKRLQYVADRFNKIGSNPNLEMTRLEPVLLNVINYIDRRLPRFGKDVKIHSDIDSDLKANISVDLFSWAIENLLKNALDAIDNDKQHARVSIRCFREYDQVVIDIEDTGKGIEKKHYEEIFQPGFSTKKRGWGLGLSLSRRIIEEYHKGRIFVLRSSAGQGTTFRIIL